MFEKEQIGNLLFYKENKHDSFFWVTTIDEDGSSIIGEVKISFDKKKVYNLFTDYPDKLSVQERDIFSKESPFWRKFFEGR